MTLETSRSEVKQLTARELKSMLDSKVELELVDVRTGAEREIAIIAGSRHLDEEGREYLQSLPPETLLVFHCHHGMRSQTAARQFLALGFSNVCNVVGGIEAWSADVDPSVPRY